MAGEILTEKRGATLIISFNRPDHGNALTFEMCNQLFSVLKPVTTDRSIRAVMLKGMGGTFMDGIEMNAYAGDLNAALERVNQIFQPYNAAMRELQVMDKPVLAAVEGNAAGSGLGFMLVCDLVLAARGAKFNSKFPSYALGTDGGISLTLTRRVGLTRANEILMLDETFGTAEAERWNLVNRVVDDGKLQEEALAWLDRLAEGPTRAYGSIKKLTMKAFEQDLNAQLALEHAHWGAGTRTFDFREAVKAHFAKRPAKFTGS